MLILNQPIFKLQTDSINVNERDDQNMECQQINNRALDEHRRSSYKVLQLYFDSWTKSYLVDLYNTDGTQNYPSKLKYTRMGALLW